MQLASLAHGSVPCRNGGKYSLVVAWLSGSALVSIKAITLYTSGPVNTWMGDRLWVSHLSITSHLGQLSLSSFRGG